MSKMSELHAELHQAERVVRTEISQGALAAHLEWALDVISMAALPVNSDKFNSARAAVALASTSGGAQ